MTVYVGPEEMLPFYRDNKDRLKREQILVAENTKTQAQVYLDIDEPLNRPLFRVFCGDEVKYESPSSESNIAFIAQAVFKNIEDNGDTEDGDDDCLSEEDMQAVDDMIYEREDALELAVFDMLDVFLEQAEDNESQSDPESLNRRKKRIASDIVDTVAELLTNYDISIFRPTWIDMEDGTMEAVDYPYQDMITE